MTLLALNLAGTFAFGLSGALAAIRARLDIFGVFVLAAVVGLAGGIIRDVLIGIRPIALRDWYYLAAVGAAAAVVLLAHPELERVRRPIDVMDAAGLSLFCVTGAIAGLEAGFGAPEAVILGVLTGIGGGILRDVLLGKVPVVFRRGLYAVPALVGAAIVVVAYRAGARDLGFAVAGAATCFALRLAGLRFNLDLPTPAPVSKRLRGLRPRPEPR
ncbi:MAG TPA: trimeric intracellular cation channel family protein [Solirubrobacterales bacterium]|nr:trimeric intracellular cation channel family protein [Solirubrobacterales bacterium]